MLRHSMLRRLRFCRRLRSPAALCSPALPAAAPSPPLPPSLSSLRLYSSQPQTAASSSSEGERREFQAETRMLLDIVAKSLYSEKEVFVRELISNASDALEKLRYLRLQEGQAEEDGRALEIQLTTDKQQRTLTFQDTGVGMTKDEVVENLGTIARSGSKEFLKSLGENKCNTEAIIGQFGVGFYSAFMVAHRVDVYTRSHEEGSVGLHWSSEGSGYYTLSEAPEVDPGTRIVLHLNAGDDAEFADEKKVEEVIKRYSNFVAAPIFLNGTRVNSLQAVWAMQPSQVSREQHEEFYKFTAHATDRPRYTMHFNLDVPVRIQAVLYVGEAKPTMWELAADAASGGQNAAVALYSRKVLIQSRAKDVVPRWARFLRGVIDSEDIPLNLSRELLQQSAILLKIRDVLASRIRKFLLNQKSKDPSKFEEFHRDFGLYLKEAIISSPDQSEKEDIASLLLYESSDKRKGVKLSFEMSLEEYVSAMQEGQKEIYYLAAPGRDLAEASPYLEALRERRHQILYCYEPYDEVVLLQLGQFKGLPLVSLEKSVSKTEAEEEADSPLTKRESDAFLQWIQLTLGSKKVAGIKASARLASHPAIVTVEEMGAARHFLRTQSDLTQEQRYMLLKPKLEVSTKHPIMRALSQLRKSDPKLAEMALDQVYDNAMVAAGLLDDPRPMVVRLNTLLGLLMDKAVTAKDTILRP